MQNAANQAITIPDDTEACRPKASVQAAMKQGYEILAGRLTSRLEEGSNALALELFRAL